MATAHKLPHPAADKAGSPYPEGASILYRHCRSRSACQHGCSFCGRTALDAGPLVNGPGVAICTACVALAADILRSRQPAG
jgi:ClpX C4-type zinc finger